MMARPRDSLSRQEKAKLEFYEAHGRIPVTGLKPDVPADAIEKRLIARGLLKVVPPPDGLGDYKVEITERGLSALRGDEWLGECSACEAAASHTDKDGDPACDSCDPETRNL